MFWDCQCGRVQDGKVGPLIGVDKYGNKYYEDKKYFFGESRSMTFTQGNTWVI